MNSVDVIVIKLDTTCVSGSQRYVGVPAFRSRALPRAKCVNDNINVGD